MSWFGGVQSPFIFMFFVVVLLAVGRASADADVDQGLSLYYPTVRATLATAQVAGNAVWLQEVF